MSNQKAEKNKPDGYLALQTLAMPKDVNINGDIFGGWIVAQMDLAGGMFAREVAGSRTVTVTIEKMTFKLPVHMGDAVSIHVALERVGNTSMDLHIEVWTKNLQSEYSAKHQLVTEGIFRYVAIDENGRPRLIPDNPRFFTRVDGRFER